MATKLMRFAFVFFLLGCGAAAFWTQPEDLGKRATQLAAETWLPQLCTGCDEACGIDRSAAAGPAWQDCSVDSDALDDGECDAKPAAYGCERDSVRLTAAEAVYMRSSGAEARELPCRRSDVGITH